MLPSRTMTFVMGLARWVFSINRFIEFRSQHNLIFRDSIISLGISNPSRYIHWQAGIILRINLVCIQTRTITISRAIRMEVTMNNKILRRKTHYPNHINKKTRSITMMLDAPASWCIFHCLSRSSTIRAPSWGS